MAQFDHDLKLITDTSARELARVAGLACGQFRPIEGTLPATTELLADRAFRASQGRELRGLFRVLHALDSEGALGHAGEIGLAVAALAIADRLPGIHPAASGVSLAARPVPSSAASTLNFRVAALARVRGTRVLANAATREFSCDSALVVAGKPTQQLWFREVCLWELRPEEWWERVPGLMALYPLCRHGRTPPDAIQHAAEAIGRAVSVASEREDQLFLLSVFGGLVLRQRLNFG